MADHTSSPVWWRIVAAFVLAPGLASIALAAAWIAVSGDPFTIRGVLGVTLGLALTGAYPAAVVLGVPAFFVLLGRVRQSMLNCALAGATVASLPWLLVGVVGAVPDGMSDLGDLVWFGEMIAAIAGAGAMGGLLFWVIATAAPRLRPRETASRYDVS